MTRCVVWGGLFLGLAGLFQKTGSRLAGRDDTVCCLGWFVLGSGWVVSKDWITAQVTPPNRYALWRGPRQAVMTRWCCLGWFVLGLGGCFEKTGSRVSHPRGAPSARDDAVLGSVGHVSGLGGCFEKTGSRLAGWDDAVLGSVGHVSGLGGCFEKTGSRLAGWDDTVLGSVGLVSGLGGCFRA